VSPDDSIALFITPIGSKMFGLHYIKTCKT